MCIHDYSIVSFGTFNSPHDTYKAGPDGFVHDLDQDHYVYPEGEIIPFKKVFKVCKKK
ncbi:hypothetical protein [Olleya sp. HaHaR_3_96]|uniref:hypothetical protein n=1 Tax=Olleya sp. HaHaR_3_96 TaxID=2745560 RepID=UPI001C4EE8BA|nr:hypothetical protein [Olleya sp. HaHaR_3_96]QXP59834.1 hypothetical protein H0I26_18315 [Olleya sp. HaHaR_3_96]